MRLSTRGRYGVAALCELAYRQEGDAPVRLREIAAAQGISESYLEQLFLGLRRAGLVLSTRGAQGGYVLARPAEDITVGQVVRVLEGPIAPVACVTSASGGGHDSCQRLSPERCPTRQVWMRLARCMTRVLDSVTLADIAFGEPGKAEASGCGGCQPGGHKGAAELEYR